MNEKEIREARGEAGVTRHRAERAERGWSVYDWWSGDTHVCQVIGSMAAEYRDQGSGFPAGMTEGEWADILTQIAEPLLAYAESKFTAAGSDEEKSLHEKARAALALFADHFDDFWD